MTDIQSSQALQHILQCLFSFSLQTPASFYFQSQSPAVGNKANKAWTVAGLFIVPKDSSLLVVYATHTYAGRASPCQRGLSLTFMKQQHSIPAVRRRHGGPCTASTSSVQAF